MQADSLQEIFTAIKNDDVKLFDEQIKKKKANLSLCYGRFPVLSLCYLYKSRKIVKEYENALAAVSTYTVVEEESEMYQKFRHAAKKSLRLYVFEDQAVSPLEMLAVTGDAFYLEEKYDSLNKNAKINGNVNKIIKTTHGWNVSTSDGAIKINKPLPKWQKLVVFIVLAAAVIMSVVPVTVWAATKSGFGFGTEQNPVKISSLQQFEAAFMDNEKYFVLTTDLALPASWEKKEFAGGLDGGGHTVSLSAAPLNGFISTLQGSLKNINFAVDSVTAEISGNTAFVVEKNEGKMENVNISLKASLNVAEHEMDELFISCLVYKNNGEIISCGVTAEAEVTGGGKDTFLTGIAAVNNGTVKDCFTANGSFFRTDTVDVSGIVTENNGAVDGCVNNAEISQQSGSDSWNPNSAGIAVVNNKDILNCFNNGAITAVSTAAIENYRLQVNAGGIVCVNFGTVEKSKSNADITALSQGISVYAGGISAVNEYYTEGNVTKLAHIKNSCSYGEIYVSAVSDKVNLFGGGITGGNYGTITDSYSACAYSSENAYTYFGGIIGLGFFEYGYDPFSGGMIFYTDNLNNYYIGRDNAGVSVAIMYLDQIYSGMDEHAVNLRDIESLKKTEVYWG